MALRISAAPLVRWLDNLAGSLASVVFPGCCRLCRGLLTEATRIPVCAACLSSFHPISPGCCKLCGYPGTGAEERGAGEEFCPACRKQKFAFQAVRSYGIYDENLVRAILLLKYERIEPLGSWFAKRLQDLTIREGGLLEADVVVPVPLHRQRERERGFNQVDVFARPLAKRLALPYRPVLLMRKRPRPEKHLLRHEERWDAVRGAFVMRSGGRVDNLRVLLLDDVMTTGATLDACSRTLHEAGAHAVFALTIARAVQTASTVHEGS